METIIAFFTTNDMIMYVLLPSLALNVLMDISQDIIKDTRIPNNITSYTSILVLLGILFGLYYNIILAIEAAVCFKYTLSIIITSYLFHKSGIWDLLTNKLQHIFKKNDENDN